MTATSGFAPSLEAARKEGIRVVRGEYPIGVAGVKLSLEQIAQRIREGALDPAVQGWAFDQLKAAGFEGRGVNAGSAFERASCLLDACRAAYLYAPDPPMTEYVRSAAALLCLRPNLCIRGGDCDDGVVLLGSVLMGVGIPARVLKQTFGAGDQEHVLIEAQDDGGRWFPLDPSTDQPAGRKNPASHEFRLDPTNPSMIGLTGAPEAEFVGVGRPGMTTKEISSFARTRQLPQKTVRGLGATATASTTSTTAAASTTSPASSFSQATTDLQNQVSAVITAGDTYLTSGEVANAISSYQAAGVAGATSVGPEIDLAGAANVTQPYTQAAWNTNTELAAISATSTSTTDGSDAQALAKSMLASYVAAIGAGQTALDQGNPGVVPPPPGGTPLGVSNVVAIVGAGAAAGVLLAWWRAREDRLAGVRKRAARTRPRKAALRARTA